MHRILARLGSAALLLLLVACSTPDDAPRTRPPGVGFDFAGLRPAADEGVHPERPFALNAHAEAGLASLSVGIDGRGSLDLPPRARTETSLAQLAADLGDAALVDGETYLLTATAVDRAGRTARAREEILLDLSAPATGGDVTAPDGDGSGGGGSDPDADGTTAELRVVPVAPTAGSAVGGTAQPIEFLVRSRDTTPAIVTVTVNGTLVDASPRFEEVAATGAFENRRYAIDWDTTTLVDGEATVRIEVEDAEGLVRAEREVVVRVFNDDTEAPEFAWIRPMPDTTIGGGGSEFAFSMSDDSGAPEADFYVDGNRLTADPVEDGSGYVFRWDTWSVDDGPHEFRAVVRDPAGNEIERTLPVIVENHDVEPPTLAWTHPADGQDVAGVVPLRFDAGDDSGEVLLELQVDGETYDGDVDSGMTWDSTTLADGEHVLRLVATDRSGNAVADEVTVTVGNDEAPSIRWAEPTQSAVVAGNDVPLVVEAWDDRDVADVEFLVDGVVAETVSDTPSSGEEGRERTFTWDSTSVPDGTRTIEAVATDGDGLTARAALEVVVANDDVEAPIVAWTEPRNEATLSGDVRLGARVTDDGTIDRVEFRRDGRTIAVLDEADDDSYGYVWSSLEAVDGTHDLTVVAHDVAGNSAEDVITVHVENEDDVPPQIVWTSPNDGVVVTGTATLEVDAFDDGGDTAVDFYVDGVRVVADVTWSGTIASVTWDSATVPDGERTLRAVARDAAELEDEATITVTVDNGRDVPPEAGWESPGEGAIVAGSGTALGIRASDDDLASVAFYAGETWLGTVSDEAALSGSTVELASWDTTEHVDGAILLRADVRDAAGNVTPVQRTVTIDNHDDGAPDAQWRSPEEGATVSGEVELRIHAVDDRAVTSVAFYANGELAGAGAEDANDEYVATWSTAGFADGEVVLRAVARDAAGRPTEVERRVTVANDVAPPEVHWTRPAASATATGPTLLEVRASDDNGIASVALRVDDRAAGSFVHVGDGVYHDEWDSSDVADGTHELVVVVTDAYGKTVEEPLQVVSANDPIVTWAAPSAGRSLAGLVPMDIDVARGRGVVRWSVGYRFEGGETVQPIASGDAASGTEPTWDTLDLAPGAYTLVAEATDADGYVDTSEIEVEVASAFVFTNPLPGDAVGEAANRRQVDVTVGLAGTLPQDAGVATVEILVGANRDGRFAARAADSVGGATFVYAWDTCESSAGHNPAVVGDRTITARVTLDDGGVVEARLTDGVTVDFQGGCP